MENHSVIKKKKQYNAIFSNIDRRRDFHTEWGKSDKDKYHMTPFIYGNNLFQKGTNEPIYKTEMES